MNESPLPRVQVRCGQSTGTRSRTRCAYTLAVCARAASHLTDVLLVACCVFSAPRAPATRPHKRGRWSDSPAGTAQQHGRRQYSRSRSRSRSWSSSSSRSYSRSRSRSRSHSPARARRASRWGDKVPLAPTGKAKKRKRGYGLWRVGSAANDCPHTDISCACAWMRVCVCVCTCVRIAPEVVALRPPATTHRWERRVAALARATNPLGHPLCRIRWLLLAKYVCVLVVWGPATGTHVASPRCAGRAT